METESSSLSFNGVSSEISFLSLLMADDSTIIQNDQNEFLQHQLPPLPPSLDDTTPSHFLSPPPDQYNLVFPISDYFPTDFHGEQHDLKPLKIEKPNSGRQNYLQSSLIEDFPAKTSAPETAIHDFPASTLPELLSLENLSPQPSKRRRKNSRETISDKIYTLGKLLPASSHHHRRRLSTVEVLEEAHKYITFLKAQVAALRSMPPESRMAIVGRGAAAEAETEMVAGGGLGRLSRRQVLEVVVNSPAAQSIMAEKGWCVVSGEQVALMKKIQARKELIRQLLNHLPL